MIFHKNFRFYGQIFLDRVRRFTSSIAIFYKEIVRPLMTYTFPVWFGISSHQMESLRVWERCIVEACFGFVPHMISSGIFRKFSCRSIYMNMGFRRIDTFLIKSAISFLGLARDLDNKLVRKCLTDHSESVRHHE